MGEMGTHVRPYAVLRTPVHSPDRRWRPHDYAPDEGRPNPELWSMAGSEAWGDGGGEGVTFVWIIAEIH